MKKRTPIPGVSRRQRLSGQGLERLERQLAAGVKISAPVLDQWVERYGDAARLIIEKYMGEKPGKGRSG